MFMSCHQTTGLYKGMVDNKSIKNVAKFRYLGMKVIVQIYIHEEIKSGLNLGNACCHAVQKILSFCLLS
jgi:hypothetical protein